MCICFLLLFFEFIFLSAAEIINSKLKYIVCFANMFSPLEEGVKLARNFLIFRNGKAEKNERIPRNTKLSPETKSPTCEVLRGCS